MVIAAALAGLAPTQYVSEQFELNVGVKSAIEEKTDGSKFIPHEKTVPSSTVNKSQIFKSQLPFNGQPTKEV